MRINRPNRIQKHTQTLNETSNPNRRAQKHPTNNENIQRKHGGNTANWTNTFYKMRVNVLNNAWISQTCKNKQHYYED